MKLDKTNRFLTRGGDRGRGEHVWPCFYLYSRISKMGGGLNLEHKTKLDLGEVGPCRGVGRLGWVAATAVARSLHSIGGACNLWAPLRDLFYTNPESEGPLFMRQPTIDHQKLLAKLPFYPWWRLSAAAYKIIHLILFEGERLK